ncbi:polysaccharide deacetylase family protein [Bacillus sp. Marseille-P3800]|uniref:polysaccharide deacetylase family protein n=1 Tax=Bacillus sp. Marseille-P3800 TaxID=2014782 RepID=UPI00210002A8|nr:polysaccharide deacetylase family protein [Bacillus sp. Marseille-P3800]
MMKNRIMLILSLLMVCSFLTNEALAQTVPLPQLQGEFPNNVFVNGDRSSNQIALTFDDGPDTRFTGQVLDKLETYNVPATFFVLGMRVNDDPELLSRVQAGGHEIANHTYSHPNLTDLSVAELEQEVNQTNEAIESVTGSTTSLFRPPYGFITREQTERLVALDYSIIGWDVDTLDWSGIPAAEVAETVLTNTQSGSIILMHDGGDVDTENPEIYSADALDEIIPALQEQGYTFVTVSELIGR